MSAAFLAALEKRGYSNTQARYAQSRLLSEGYRNPTAWHAARYDDLLTKAFIKQRQSVGVTPTRAYRELRRLQSEGVKQPGSWHADRIDAILYDAFISTRERLGVPTVLAEKEFAKLQFVGIPPYFPNPVPYPGSWHAERLPRPVPRKRKRKEIDDIEELIALLEEAEFFEYEEWVSSLDY